MRYFNKLAYHFLFREREAKWYPAGSGPPTTSPPGQTATTSGWRDSSPWSGRPLRTAMRHSDRTDVTIRRQLFHLDARVEPIWDWRNELPTAQHLDREPMMTGALFHTHDVSYLNRAFEALEELITASGANEVIERTIKAMRRLDHRWCRLYVINPRNESELVSLSCFGPKPDVEEWEDKFNRGDYMIPRYDDDYRWEGWQCLKDKRPLVLFHDPNRVDKDRVVNKYGLEAVNCRTNSARPSSGRSRASTGSTSRCSRKIGSSAS